MKLAEAKWKLLKHEQYLNRQAKTSQYLMNKGYEPTLVQETIQQIRRAAKE
jgi:regulatory protein